MKNLKDYSRTQIEEVVGNVNSIDKLMAIQNLLGVFLDNKDIDFTLNHYAHLHLLIKKAILSANENVEDK